MKTSIEYPRFQVRSEENKYRNFCIRKKNLRDYDLHWHDCFEIELILSGDAFQELNGEKYRLTRGDIYLLNPTDFHRVQGNGAEVYNIMFSEELLSDDLRHKILTVNRNLLFHLSEEEFDDISHLISQMLREYQRQDAYADVYIQKLLECVFLTILRKCAGFSGDERAGDMKKALLYLHSHFRENPSMTDMAGLFGFNTNYFSTRFHQFTGKTFKSYLNLLKLEYAKKLLLSGDLPVTEIGFAAGFTSLPNFLRCFKAHFGMSPGALRRVHESASTI